MGISRVIILHSYNDYGYEGRLQQIDNNPDLEEIILPPDGGPNILQVYHLYVIRTKNREDLMRYLRDNGIQCGIHYPIPIHLQPIYRKKFAFEEGDFPNSELLSKSCLSLPMYPDLVADDIEFVCEKIHTFFN